MMLGLAIWLLERILPGRRYDGHVGRHWSSRPAFSSAPSSPSPSAAIAGTETRQGRGSAGVTIRSSIIDRRTQRPAVIRCNRCDSATVDTIGRGDSQFRLHQVRRRTSSVSCNRPSAAGSARSCWISMRTGAYRARRWSTTRSLNATVQARTAATRVLVAGGRDRER